MKDCTCDTCKINLEEFPGNLSNGPLENRKFLLPNFSRHKKCQCRFCTIVLKLKREKQLERHFSCYLCFTRERLKESAHYARLVRNQKIREKRWVEENRPRAYAVVRYLNNKTFRANLKSLAHYQLHTNKGDPLCTQLKRAIFLTNRALGRILSHRWRLTLTERRLWRREDEI